ncbi:monofunctional biosynthetic peptidoglycan transglycosylase [Niabella ginsenosidivorans]|uniref:Biosynthetic peptidoglycan transglycosylase n=1 Tax=Niabella ginsenosidivorans TaxID=1176587 RepID=A0A1A9I8L6_9BACT|nr:monofunctional biosynthetic peptidoglycan transglycosylase [Niabella ginsenosidivorans]ANH83012.1 monofunctional biosynthetic peptidoglycan transglycosylase [Niabella ginsenosidivorans]
MRVLKGIWKWGLRLFVVLFIGQFIYIVLLKWVNPPVTFTQIGSMLAGRGCHSRNKSSADVSENARLAVIASEDQLFPDHNGFDWKSIQKAIEYNQKKPGRLRGASTISQQTAKNVFLWQGRSWFRKGLETYFTFMIERIWGKKRILEVYLNVAETGNGIFGIEQAAQTYFNKPAKNLTQYEAAAIAAILPNPLKLSVRPMSPYVASRARKIVQQMNFLKPDRDIQRIVQAD